MMSRVVAESDVVITTAAVPGKKAPILVTAEMVEGMHHGSVVVDLAAERGGNCELTRAGETVVHRGVTVLGPLNLPAMVPHHASQLYAKNISTFLLHLVSKGALQVNLDDEITAGTLVARDGKVVHPMVLEAMGAAAARGGAVMSDLVMLLTVFVLAIFVGIEIITKVPPTLHTPLMSGSNAISGITIVGALVLAGALEGTELFHPVGKPLALAALIFATINVVGGFVVTHRMLKMFRRK